MTENPQTPDLTITPFSAGAKLSGGLCFYRQICSRLLVLGDHSNLDAELEFIR